MMTSITKNKKITILLLILSLLTVFFIKKTKIFTENYNIDYVERLTYNIIKNNGSLKMIEELLEYNDNTIIDASFSLHYYGNLYYIYSKYPNNILFFNNKKKYRKIIKKILEDGKNFFDEYYSGYEKPDYVSDFN